MSCFDDIGYACNNGEAVYVERSSWADDLEEFDYRCPYCGEEMEKIEVSYRGGFEVAQYMCTHCDEDKAHMSRTWVFEGGIYDGYIAPDELIYS